MAEATDLLDYGSSEMVIENLALTSRINITAGADAYQALLGRVAEWWEGWYDLNESPGELVLRHYVNVPAHLQVSPRRSQA